MAKPGVAGGTTRSIYIGDRGGLFTQLGLGLLFGVAAAGTVKPGPTTTSSQGIYDGGGNRIGTRTTTTYTGTVDAQAGQDLQRSYDAASGAAGHQLRGGAQDPTQKFDWVTGGLEIASQKLGGDTSGWMFDFGWKGGRRYGDWGLRSAVKFGFGKFTYEGRMVERLRTGAVAVEDSDYTFFGVPIRLGITYRGAVELFGQLDLNLVTAFREALPGQDEASPSPWRAGVRVFAAKMFYAEAGVAMSTMRAVNRSTMLEVGLEF